MPGSGTTTTVIVELWVSRVPGQPDRKGTDGSRKLQQVVVFVNEYLGSAGRLPGAAAAWRGALEHIPGLAAVRSTRWIGQPLPAEPAASLVDSLADIVLRALGHSPTARAALAETFRSVADLVPSAIPASGRTVTANLVTLEELPAVGVDDAEPLLTHLALTVAATADPDRKPWGVDVDLTAYRLDLRQITSDEKIATRWQRLMGTVSPDEIERCRDFHRIVIPLDEDDPQVARSTALTTP